MIAFIQGKVIKSGPPSAIVLNNGIGYSILTNDFLVEGSEVSLYIETIYKEDSISLIGFLDRTASIVFKNLLALNGIGAVKALSLIKNVGAENILSAVRNKDKDRLLNFKGISEKIAYSIVTSMKIPSDLISSTSLEENIEQEDEVIAVRTLVELGFDESSSRNAVFKVRNEVSQEQEDRLSQLVTLALGNL